MGDFHGKFQKKWERLIKKEKIGLVVSVGDFKPFSMKKLFFEKIYKKNQDKELWDFIGRKKFKELHLKDMRAAESVLRKMQRLEVPVFTVFGNNDWSKWPEAIDEQFFVKEGKKRWKWPYQDFFTPLVKKYSNIHDINYSYKRLGDYVLIGGGPSSFPGRVKSKNYKKLKSKLDKLFREFSKQNRKGKVIFISHNVPYNTKLDLITDKKSHKKARGKHYGSKLVRRIIEKYQPALHIGGHIHERQGKSKLGKTLCINTGGAHDGEAAIIKIEDNGKIGVRFIK